MSAHRKTGGSRGPGIGGELDAFLAHLGGSRPWTSPSTGTVAATSWCRCRHAAVVAAQPRARRRRCVLGEESFLLFPAFMQAKYEVAICCVKQSGRLLEDVYSKVASVADDCRCLYDEDVMAGIGDDDFRVMMFFDACFLVQYMLLWSSSEVDPSLHRFFGPNRRDIRHDILLLENQLPWKVVKAVMEFKPVPLERFVFVMKQYLQDHKAPPEEDDAGVPELDSKYEAPHLLGLIRHYAVGRCNDRTTTNEKTKKNRRRKDKPKTLSISTGAMELAKMGIMLTANNQTTELSHMELHHLVKLSMVPLALDHNRASYLVNMAALELCTVENFYKEQVEKSDVCSYLLLLATLASRTEDVHALRAKGILQGGGGLSNDQAVEFFTSLQGLNQGRGRRYLRIMRDIQMYKENWWALTKIYGFLYKHWKIITGAASAISFFVGILKAIQSIGR
ncbi:hypothetical protein BS78_04G017700 [Paspalum vaginatum]|nr:hypothetical protein BS78_04G017700 [Paspalum vaginatum]